MRYHEISENRTGDGVRAIRCEHAEVAGTAAWRVPAAFRRVQKETGITRAEEEGQAFPRPCRSASSLESFRLRRGHLAGEFIPCEPLAYGLSNSKAEAPPVSHRRTIFVLTVIEAEHLFVNVAEQVERFDGNIGSIDAALQETPEVLKAVGMHVAIHVRLKVIDGIVHVVLIESADPVMAPFIRHQVRTRFDIPGNLRGDTVFLAVRDHGSAHALWLTLRGAFQHSENDGLTASTSARLLNLALAIFVHVPHAAADEGFINLDFTTKVAPGQIVLKGKPDSLQHEPSGLLGNSHVEHDFVTANAVLAIGDQPYGHHPLVKAQRGVLKDSSDLHGELPLRVLSGALPNLAISDVPGILPATSRAYHDAIRPTANHQVIQAVFGIGKVKNRFLESGWFGCHNSILQENKG